VGEFLDATGKVWHDVSSSSDLLRAKAGKQWHDLFFKAADAYMKMRRAVSGGLNNVEGVTYVAAELESGTSDPDAAALVATYRRQFEQGDGPIRGRLKELEAEHDRITNGLLNLPPNSRAVAKQQARLLEVEQEITDTEAKLTNVADQLEDTRRELAKLATEWGEAAEAMHAESSARRKAEAVRKVIHKIVVTFKPTGKKHPTSEVVDVEIVPQGGTGDVTGKCPNGVSSTRCTSRPASTSTTTSAA
jgi:copper chaperone CopZ